MRMRAATSIVLVGLIGVALAGCVGAAKTAQASASASPSVSTSVGDPHLNLEVERTVSAGGSIDIPVAFEGTSDSTVQIFSAAPGIAASLGGVNLDAATTSTASFLGKSFTSPTDGVLHIVNPGTADAAVQVSVLIDTTRYLTITPSSKFVSSGGAVTIDVSLTDATASDQATAYLEDQAGTRTTIELTKVDTGHWTARITPTVGGNAKIFVQTGGDRPRYESSPISVSSGNVTFGAGFSESAIDSDHDGLTNTLRLTIAVTANRAASYDLTAHLVDAQGKEVAIGNSTVSLVAGTQQIAIDFDGSTIYKSGSSGPYRLVNVGLTNTEAVTHMEALASDLGSTQAYDYTTFQH